MLMKAIVLVVVAVVSSSVRVVQGQTTDPCEDFSSKNKCGKKDECTWNSGSKLCLLTAGTGSIVRDGSQNAAPGNYCAVGGGQQNTAGFFADAYNVIGGGQRNTCFDGSKNTISGGNRNGIASIAGADVQDFDTISGGLNNLINDGSYSVITGGGGGDEDEDGEYNLINGCDTSTISGGKKNRILGSDGGSGGFGHTMTGGFENTIVELEQSETHIVLSGGSRNAVVGGHAVVAGGDLNYAFGVNSLAFGQNTATNFEHSMVVNLIGGVDEEDRLLGTKDGEFLVSAESFRFQIGNGNDGIDSAELTKTNIKNLRNALEEEE